MRKLVLLLVAALIASGQIRIVTPEERKVMLGFQLTMPLANHLLAAIPEMTKYLVSLPDFKERLRKSAKETPAERLAAFENDPKAMAILKRNSLTAREYLIGTPTLRNAVYAAKFGAQGTASDENGVSAANLAFAKANIDELYPKMRAADGASDKK